MKVIKNVVVKTGEYVDRNGNTKGRFERVGRVMRMDDGREMVLLNRTFNPAGVNSDKDSIILNFFDVDEKREVPTEAIEGIKKLETASYDDDNSIPF